MRFIKSLKNIPCHGFFAVILLIGLAFSVFAQEKNTISAGVLVEANANTRHGYGLAGGIIGDYGFTDWFAAGVKLDYGTDFYDVSSFEALAFGRFYLQPSFMPFPLFAQVGAGFISLYEDDRSVASVLADGSLGIRFPIKNFYTEQYVRFGWPTGFGFGLAIGYRFNRKAPPPLETPPPEPVQMARLPPEAEEELKPVVKVVEAEPPEGHIFFLPNSDSFDDMTDPRLTRLFERNLLLLFNIASYMNAYPQYTLRITGYANPVDKTEAEETESLIPLSGRRAAYVKDRLIELGVDEGRLFSTGLGGRGTDPAASENNRRVEFSFEK